MLLFFPHCYIYPTQNQQVIFERAFGVRRWTWNWGLETYLKSLNEVNESSEKKYGKSKSRKID